MRIRFACDFAFLKLAVAFMFAGIFIYSLAAQNSPTAASSNHVTLTYMGTAGWEITDGKTVVLVDPYLTRLKTNTPNDSPLDSDPRPLVNRNDFDTSDPAVIDAHIKRADFILITHTHLDHVLDVPYIASKTGALVIGTESTANFARDNGVPNSQILTVKGGEDVELSSGCSVRVIPSLHGILRRAARSSQQQLPDSQRQAFDLAIVKIGLGDKDAALAWLEKAYQEHDDGLVELKIEPLFDPLRSDPRFQSLLRRMNFPT